MKLDIRMVGEFLIIWIIAFVVIYSFVLPKHGDFEAELFTGIIFSLIVSAVGYSAYRGSKKPKKK